MKRAVFASVLAFLFADAAFGQQRVYACKNAAGKMELTDRPCDTNSTTERLKGEPPPKISAGMCNAARAAARQHDTPANRAAVQRHCDVK